MKQRKNDKGEKVPEKCSCGGTIKLELHSEPVFLCDKCKKYYGTLPFNNKKNIKENKVMIMTESKLRNIINESVKKVLKEGFENLGIEDIPVYEVINKNVSLTEIDDILESTLFDANGNEIGKLGEMYFRYDNETNEFI